MTQAIEFEGVVSGGHMPPPVRSQISEAIRRMEGKRLVVKISEPKKQRSSPQNRYYFGVIVPHVQQMFVDAGNNVGREETHEYLKQHIGKLTMVIETPDGLKRTVTRSSTELSTKDAEEYFEKIRAWAAEFGCQIPLPNEEIAAQNHQAANSTLEDA